MSGKNAQLGNQFPYLVKTAGEVKSFHYKNTLANAQVSNITDTLLGYYCTRNTGNRLICLQVPCQASVVVISALETCLAVKLKNHKKDQCLH